MIGDCTEADGPGENVAGHTEDQEDSLSSTTKFPSDPGHTERLEQNLESVGHIVNLETRQVKGMH